MQKGKTSKSLDLLNEMDDDKNIKKDGKNGNDKSIGD